MKALLPWTAAGAAVLHDKRVVSSVWSYNHIRNHGAVGRWRQGVQSALEVHTGTASLTAAKKKTAVLLLFQQAMVAEPLPLVSTCLQKLKQLLAKDFKW